MEMVPTIGIELTTFALRISLSGLAVIIWDSPGSMKSTTSGTNWGFNYPSESQVFIVAVP